MKNETKDKNLSFSFKKNGKNSIELTVENTELDELHKNLYKNFGTVSKEVFHNLVLCVSYIYGDDYTDDNIKFMAEFIKELKPRDTLETMLMAQMLATHNMSMKSFYRVGLKDQTTYGVEANIERATKFTRTYLAQMETLKKYRSKGKQKIIVKHINVGAGGKAIIGDVNAQINNPNG